MNKVFKQNIIVSMALFLGVLTMALFLLPSKAYAACEDDGAYGKTCVFEKNFEIEKNVR